MMKNNREFDTLTIYAKKDKAKEIVEYYKSFCWILTKESPNKLYEDLVDLTFKRPHKIENKDELQLLQVYMEENLNETARLERNKHSKTIALSLSFGVLSIMLLIFGSLFCCNIFANISLVTGIILVVIGAIICIVLSIFLPKLFKKEKLFFEQKHNEFTLQLEKIFEKTNFLVGGGDEQQK